MTSLESDPLGQAMRPKAGSSVDASVSTETLRKTPGVKDTFTGAKYSNSPSFASKIPRVIAYVLSFGMFYGISKLAVEKGILPALKMYQKEDPNADRIKNNLLKDPQNRNFTLTTYDGAKIDGMLLGSPNNGKPVLMYFCGNAERWEYSLDYPQRIAKELDANVLVFNYRGVGRSEGFPLVAQDLVTDGDTCKQYLNHLGIDDSRIKIFARSIGAGIGVEVASRYERTAFVSERSFSKFSKEVRNIMGAGVIGSLASQTIKMMEYEMKAAKAWKKIPAEIKLAIVHKGDKMIQYPVSLAYKLQKSAAMGEKSENAGGIKTHFLRLLGIHSHSIKTHREQVNVLELKDRARGFKDDRGFVGQQKSLDVMRQEYAEKLEATNYELFEFALDKFPEEASVAKNNPDGFMQQKIESMEQDAVMYLEGLKERQKALESSEQFQTFIAEKNLDQKAKQMEVDALQKKGLALAEQLDADPMNPDVQAQFNQIKADLDYAKLELDSIKQVLQSFFEKDPTYLKLKGLYEESAADLQKMRILQSDYHSYQPGKVEEDWSHYGDVEEDPHNVQVTGPEFEAMISRMRVVYQLAEANRK